jgi:cell division protein FtsI/penicillin-binding protein 2
MVLIQFGPQADFFIEQGDQHAGVLRVVNPARGHIYDRGGNLLAGNKTVFEVGVELKAIEEPESIALAVSVVLGLEYSYVLDLVSREPTPDAVFVVIQDFVDPEAVGQLRYMIENENTLGTGNLVGLVFTPHLQRSYPEINLASNILGFVSRTGEGYFGIEEKYGDMLAGKAQEIFVSIDPNQVDSLPEIPPGASLILTIDRDVQAFTEAVLDEAMQLYNAESGTIVIMDPNTGDIIAMATSDRIDLNEFWRHTDVISGTVPFNSAVSQGYEPGSVFKVLTMASALDAGVVTPTTEFLDTGLIEIGGAPIRNWNRGAWGPQTMETCMQHSLNVCLAWVATQLGPADFYRYMEAFGFGQTTGVDLAGEVPGRLKSPGDPDWYPADLGTNSFGQGISTTPIQMLMAISALANEGQMVLPRLVKGIINNGIQYEPEPQTLGYPITRKTARQITRMLANSLQNEASNALVPGYLLAGKTGTAEIPTPIGYTSNVTNASFVGWGPVDDPQFLVYVWIERPGTSIWGSEVAAPVFARVVERLVVYLNIPPDGAIASQAFSTGQ